MDPYQTAPIDDVCHRNFLNSSTAMKADDFCFDWRFNA